MQETCVFHDHLVGLGHVQEGGDQLVILDGDDVVQVLLNIGEHLVAGGFHRHAVGDGVHGGQGDDVACLQAGLHGLAAPVGSTPMTFTLGLRSFARVDTPAGQAAAADGHQDDVHIRAGC